MHSASSQLVASSRSDKQIFNAVILRHANSEVLLARDGFQFELPIVIIPTGRRVAEEINQFISCLWGLQTVCLFQSEPSSCNSGDTNPFVVLEARDASWLPPANFQWISRREIANRLYSVKEARSLQEVIATADTHKDSSLSGPFTRVGWFDDLLAWVQEQLDPHGLQLTGRFCQLNADSSFSLVRLETNGPAIWFKAVGEPNRHEFRITVALSRQFPAYLPALIATEPAWNGWLAFEARGSTLDEKSNLAAWEAAATRLAELQIESIQKTGSLPACCRNARLNELLKNLDTFLELMTDLMGRQTKVPPPQLTSKELGLLDVEMRALCTRLGELDIPDTVGHLDFNPGNIVVDGNTCVFLDWAEAYVGHPFLTFEYLREHLRRLRPHDPAWQARVTSSYLGPWLALIPAVRLNQALLLTPAIAVFAYATTNGIWRDPQTFQNQQMAGLFRGLTRRMHREARLTRAGGFDA